VTELSPLAGLLGSAFHTSAGTKAESAPAIKKPASRSFQSIDQSMAKFWNQRSGDSRLAGGVKGINPQAEFLTNWHIEVIASKLAAVRSSLTRRTQPNSRYARDPGHPRK